MPRLALFVALMAGLAALPTVAIGQQTTEVGSRFTAGATGRLGVVATESPAASRVGRAVLEDGGNAIDAAAATVLAMGVARPQSCGLGGGGFMLYRSRTGVSRALDFRETAGQFMRPSSLVGPGLHQTFTGHLTVGVPGTVAGLDSALRRYGTLTLAEAIAPAERLAGRGLRVPTSLSTDMADNAARLQLFAAARAQFLVGGQQPYAPGATLRQPELAATLRRLQRGGARAFYRGTIARRIVRDMRAPRPVTRDPGLLTLGDFARYTPRWRTPIRGTYRGRRVLLMPPPTSGGIAIDEMLNILEGFDLGRAGQSSAPALHVLAEAQKIAFADRSAYVADPDFVPVPTGRLTSKAYAATRRAEITGNARTYAPGLGPALTRPAGLGPAAAESSHDPAGATTHISIIDRRGNAVSLTCTIEQEFGSAVVAPGTGFLLNNELTDFSAPGTANQPEPGKRPRSSMSPTIVVGANGRPNLVVGGAGGARIIMGTLLPVVNFLDFGNGVAGALDAPRIDAAAAPGRLEIEEARIVPEVLADLQARGHQLVRLGEYASRPRLTAAGEDRLQPGIAPPPPPRPKVALSDPRTDQAALAERRR